jgi:uncharacterized protein (TIGR02453 family)
MTDISGATVPEADMPATVCGFLRDLAANNQRDWFEANRKRYESEWLEPAKAYVEAMASFMQTLDPPHKAQAKVNGSIRRINRDVRFSKDKRPYDPRLHLVFWTGDHPNRSPGIHLVLHPDRLGLGAGHWAMSPDELTRYRHAVCEQASGQALLDITNRCAQQGFLLGEETLKRVPSGFDADDERASLLKRKSLVVRTGEVVIDPKRICDQTFMGEALGELAAINRWLVGHVVAG